MAQVPAVEGIRGHLTLSESADETGTAAPWVKGMFLLGANIARYSKRYLPESRQLIVVVSVPGRDFAAALIGCGWVRESTPGDVSRPDQIPFGAPVRLVTRGKIVTGLFQGLELGRDGTTRVKTTGGLFQAQAVRAIAQLDIPVEERARDRPDPGTFADYTDMAGDWDCRLAAPAGDLAIVGTRSWLDEDFDCYLGVSGKQGAPTKARDVLLPSGVGEPSVYTNVYKASKFADENLPEKTQAVILDGATAIRYLSEVEARVVICVLDRSVVDETAAETLLQQRVTRGRPLEEGSLDWPTPPGIEGMAFTVNKRTVRF